MSTAGARALLAAAAAFGLACARGPAPPPAAPGAVRAAAPARVVMVSIAGLTPARYLPQGDARRTMPTLAGLAAEGAAARRVEPVTPAASLPAHASLVTGRTPSQHGVTGDTQIGDVGVMPRSPAQPTPLRGPALWDVAKRAGKRSAVLAWPASSASSAELRYPETVPSDDPRAFDELLAQGLPAPWLETARRLGAEAPEARVPSAKRDAVVVGLACELVRSSEPPGLVLVALAQTEPVLRASGPDGPAADAAFAAADAELGRLVGCLRGAGRLDDTALLVVGDHGWLPIHTVVSPNLALVEAGLATPLAEGDPRVEKWSALARSNGGSAFVYARRQEDAVLARRALQSAAERTRAFRIVTADEMLRLAADPEAWFGLEAAPGWVFGDAASGAWLAAASERGGGGYLPDREEMGPGFVASGAGLRGRIVLPLMRQTDVAPTAALLLGGELSETDGRPLVGILGAALAR